MRHAGPVTSHARQLADYTRILGHLANLILHIVCVCGNTPRFELFQHLCNGAVDRVARADYNRSEGGICGWRNSMAAL